MTNRYCFHADESLGERDTATGFLYYVVKITENEPGYEIVRKDITLDTARNNAWHGNQDLGLTADDVYDIRTSSMAAHNAQQADIDDEQMSNRHRGRYLLLTDSDGWAKLIDLNSEDNHTGRGWLRKAWSHVAHGDDGQPIERAYVLDPAVNHGQPTLCRFNGVTGPFDENDYAQATHTIMLDQVEPFIVHRFSYAIDGRS